MSIPIGVGAGAIATLIILCADLVIRLRKLPDTYSSIKENTGALHMLFSDLDHVLSQFQDIPPLYEEALYDIRVNCHKTLTDISVKIERFEDMQNMGRVQRWAKKLSLGVQNKEPELGAKLKDHRDVVVQLLMLFKQSLSSLRPVRSPGLLIAIDGEDHAGDVGSSYNPAIRKPAHISRINRKTKDTSNTTRKPTYFARINSKLIYIRDFYRATKQLVSSHIKRSTEFSYFVGNWGPYEERFVDEFKRF
ncbi:hypothetical protein V8E51_014835 [Hyaloscypha variabilis]